MKKSYRTLLMDSAEVLFITTWEDLARECIQQMSEDECESVADSLGFLIDKEEETEEEE